MAKTSAGLIMYRQTNGDIEVLLVHPGGPFWANKDAGAWSIPKGEYVEGEDPLATAIREFEEELGFAPTGNFTPIGSIKQSGGKIVTAWAFEGDCDPTSIRSNTFTMEWPPKSGNLREFPEVDVAAWWPIEIAKVKIIGGQIPLLENLVKSLTETS
jgi:predicted NUDIX family NTP pyrophosphohydrolase